MPEVYAQSHLVCLPSSYGEGIPKVLIEAAACGRAIVTTDTPGCREIARHGENGLCVPPDQTDALYRAIKQLVEDPAQRQRMGKRGREIAEAEFSLERICHETLAVYQNVLAASRRQQR
jgi:glycosyltransferase involved in cell wall biosynthesis